MRSISVLRFEEFRAKWKLQIRPVSAVRATHTFVSCDFHMAHLIKLYNIPMCTSAESHVRQNIICMLLTLAQCIIDNIRC